MDGWLISAVLILIAVAWMVQWIFLDTSRDEWWEGMPAAISRARSCNVVMANAPVDAAHTIEGDCRTCGLLVEMTEDPDGQWSVAMSRGRA